MPLPATCRKAVLLGALTLCGYSPAQASQIINFSANLVNGTCDLELDRTHIDLGTLSQSSLEDGHLLAPQTFFLSIVNCVGGGAKPELIISGEESSYSRFRNATSTSSNISVKLFLFDPDGTAIYSGQRIVLDTIPDPGGPYTFYTGMWCDTSCSEVTPGTLEASITIEFRYL